MLPEGTIEARHIWKRFRADKHRRLARDEFEQVVQRVAGRGTRGWRWALRDVDLITAPGESIGLVGTNGSGKTTLLKILTRVMYPYAGTVSVAGRVGALIEVRAGIHPDLTGRENIHLYGSLLGLQRSEVARRFDEIVAFAEVEDAIDRQVKFYSSGMQMRLGFAVVAFLEPDVLLVDEVLAVGDASFQQKCLDRMRVVLSQGTTLIFVSHDLAAVEATCARGLWLANGEVRAVGPVSEVLGSYRGSIELAAEAASVEGVIRLVKAEVGGPNDGVPRSQDAFVVKAIVESPEPRPASIFIGISEGPATPIFVLRRDAHLSAGETEVRCSLPRLPLPRGRFYLWIGVFAANGHVLLPWHPAAHFDVAGPGLDRAPRAIVRLSPVHVDAEWKVERR